MLTLLKAQDLHQYLYEDVDVPDEEDQNEAKTSFLIKKNISQEIYYLVRNLSRPNEIWNALRQHYSSTSKRNIQTCKRALREITIESCSYDITTYLQKKADAIDALIDLEINIDDNEMSDLILEGLERDFRLTDFLFFQSTQENSDYHRLIADIQVYVNSPSFKMKYGKRTKPFKANYTSNSKGKKRNTYHCDYCNKSGHSKDYCYVNPQSKKYKGEEKVDKLNVQLHTSQVAKQDLQNLRDQVVLDSGATDHFFCNEDMFIGEMRPFTSSLECASGNIPITGIGSVKFETTETVITIDNVLFVPGLTVNLVSLLKLEAKGVHYTFHNGIRYLKLRSNVISYLNVSSHLIVMKLPPKRCALSQAAYPNTEKDHQDIHSALGHISFDKIKHLKLNTGVEINYPCDICETTKATRNVPRRKHKKPHRHLYELIHTDICEMPVISVDGFRYFALFMDDASKYSHLILLRKKSDIYKGFSDLLEDGSITISTIRSDQGSEYLSKTFQSLCISNDIRQEFSSVATPEEMGSAERLNRTLLEKVRPMLRESSLPTTFWSFAILTANFLYNRTPHSSLEQNTPFLLRYGISENYERLIPFGCRVNVYVQKGRRGKLDNTTKPGIMLGYSRNSTEYMVLDFESADIIMAPSTSSINPKIFPSVPADTLTNFILKQEGNFPSEDTCDEGTYYSESLIGNSDSRKIYLIKIEAPPENMQEASNRSDAKEWIDAVQREMKSLQSFKAYEIVKIPEEHQVVSTRFVFNKKYSDKSNDERYKARIVVRGFELKTNFGDTFAPTPHLDTFRLLVAYCAKMAGSGYSLFSIDFVSAFLNAINDPHVYVTPPEGVKIRDGYCWRLKRALYGTARAPRLWHKTLELLLHNLGFVRSVADACLYYRRTKTLTELIFFHVDDLILCTVPNSAKAFIESVKKKFKIHDMGFPTETLGIQIRRDSSGIHLSTKRSEEKILLEFEMEDSGVLRTPLPPGLKLPALTQVPNPVNITKYRRLLGKLLYLSRCVRYDICYATNLLSRYATNHNKSIWKNMKDILRYLKSTNWEISYSFKSSEEKPASCVTAWSDASFSDDTSTRKSTIGYFVFWCGYIIAWNSTKTKAVTLSTTESEFIAAAQALRTGLYLKNINSEIFQYFFKLILCEDNQSCIKWLKNATGYHARTKHIDICYHFAREMHDLNLLEIRYVSTTDQIADLLTKALPAPKHKNLLDKISRSTISGGM